MTKPKSGTGLRKQRQHQVDYETFERTSEGRRSCTSKEAKSTWRAERQVQSTKKDNWFQYVPDLLIISPWHNCALVGPNGQQ